ncbi:hypothetical protein T4A_4083 [Trichinella pseudospiralis]|uniref:Uncharacterized protein n=1 Tax=Trichinella pseudospiralis TaxID=6337 RepID=A0A0V1E4C0_TRIPS|nr:hypothetical protein T4A_4083 [Trichinella pseudospiralis]
MLSSKAIRNDRKNWDLALPLVLLTYWHIGQAFKSRQKSPHTASCITKKLRCEQTSCMGCQKYHRKYQQSTYRS